jgi:NDP-hexose-3-ketoreductase
MSRPTRNAAMRLLFLGYSSIVRRRVLPAARQVAGIEAIAVASRSQPPVDGVRWFRDYDEALGASGADAVYVSGFNSDHAERVTQALSRGFHVMVDKPAFLHVADAEAAAGLAARQGRLLAEATVFAFHPQVGVVQRLVADDGAVRAALTFSMPPRPDDDFRMNAAAGGGSLNDLGAYAAATSRLIFRQAPATVSCAVLTRRRDVDTAFSVLMTYPGGGSLTGHFGFDTAYQNRLSLLTRSRQIDVDRFFSTPPDMALPVNVNEQGQQHVLTIDAADSFALFLTRVHAAIADGREDTFADSLLADARLVERMRHAGDA